MWPFKRKQQSGLPDRLIYKSGEAFFEMQCKYGHTTLGENTGIVGIVLDAKREFGVETAVKVQPNGTQLATLRIAGEEGGFVTFAETGSAGGDVLKPGDLVVWVPGIYNQQLAQKMGDDRAGWIGLIRAKIAPESNTADNSLVILSRY